MSHKEKIRVYIDHDGQITYPDYDDRINVLRHSGEHGVLSFDDNRKLWRHKKYFKMLSKVINHMPEHLSERFPTCEALHHEIKLQLGLWELHVTLGGKETYKVQSISFASMGEKRFREYVDQSRDVILKHFLFGVNIETFEREFMSLIFD